MRAKEFDRTRALVGGLLVGLLLMTLAFFLNFASRQQHESDVSAMAEKRLGEVADALSQAINLRLHLTISLDAFVRVEPDFTPEQFEQFATVLEEHIVGIRSLQLAPGGVVRFATHPERNRQAIGLDLLANPTTRESAQSAVREHRFDIVGPVRLVQGGSAVIARRPLYTGGGGEGESFWGFATVLIELESLLEEAGIEKLERDYQLGIRTRYATGDWGEPFRGPATLFEHPLAVADLALPNKGSWQLALVSRGTVQPVGVVYSPWFWIVGLFGSIVVGFLAYSVLDKPRKLQQLVVSATEDLRATLDSIGDAVIATDTEGLIRRINPVAGRLTGWSPQEALGRPLETVFRIRDESSDDLLDSPVREVLKKQRVVGLKGHTLLMARSGEVKQISDSAAPIRNSEGEITGVVLVFRDVTEEYQVRSALQRSEERFREFAATAADWFWELGPDLRFSYVSGRVEEVMGLKPEQVIGHNRQEIYGDRFDLESPTWRRHLERLATHQPFNDFDIEWQRADGEWVVFSLSGVPQFDEQGEFAGYRGVGRDITRRRQIERDLREEQERTRRVIEGTNAGTWDWNLETGQLVINERWAEIIGYTLDELQPISLETWSSSVHPEDLFIAQVALQRHFEGELDYYDVEFRQQHKQGHWVWVNARGRVVEWNAEGKPARMSGTHLDITARKQGEQEIRRLRNYLANIIDSMPSVLVGVDGEGRVTQWNRQATRLTGTPGSKAVGQPLAEVFPRLKGELERVREAIRTRQQQQASKQRLQTPEGPVFEEVTVYPLTANGVEGAVIRLDDVSERVRLEEMMIQSEKMLSVGGLAAGMAHEINNPLAGILQTANVMSNRLLSPALPANRKVADQLGLDLQLVEQYMQQRGVLRMLNAINESGKRVAEIVNNMLSFARKSDAAVSSGNLPGLLEKSLELAATDYDLKKAYDFRSIEIVRDYQEGLPDVPCEAGKIQQVLLNLLRNGAQAMQQARIEHPRFTLRCFADPGGRSIVMEIEDNGPGMDEPTCKRIFEPFFTTKAVGLGTGLGLSVSYFIITENHGGEMWVHSEPGKGACFSIRLPLERKE